MTHDKNPAQREPLLETAYLQMRLTSDGEIASFDPHLQAFVAGEIQGQKFWQLPWNLQPSLDAHRFQHIVESLQGQAQGWQDLICLQTPTHKSQRAILSIKPISQHDQQPGFNLELFLLNDFSLSDLDFSLGHPLLDIYANWPDSVIFINRQGSIVYTNDAWNKFALANNAEPTNLGVGTNFLEVCRRVEGPEKYEADQAIKAVERIFDNSPKSKSYIEFPCHAPDEYRWFIQRVYRIEMPFETLAAMVYEDVSRYKLQTLSLQETTNRLKLANQSNIDLISHISHEIRTPLHAVQGFSQSLKSFALPESTQEHIENILKYCKKLTDTFDQIIQGSGPQTATIDNHAPNFSLHDLQVSLQERWQNSAAKQGLDFSCETLSSDPHLIKSDYQGIQQILSDLLDNAVEFTENGAIQVTLDLQDEAYKTYLIATVSDTGQGMNAQQLDRIKQAFAQDSGNNFAHLGRGLSLIKNYLDLYNGQLRIDSQLEKGSRFEVKTPVQLANKLSSNSSSTSIASGDNHNEMDQQASEVFLKQDKAWLQDFNEALEIGEIDQAEALLAALQPEFPDLHPILSQKLNDFEHDFFFSLFKTRYTD